MSVDATVQKPIASPQDFCRFLELGRHRLPIDTATSWSVYPISDPHKEPKRQIFQVELRLDVLSQGKPVGFTDYYFRVGTLEKAAGLIRKIRECNIRWQSWLTRVEPSFDRRAIKLCFREEPVGMLVRGDQSTVDLGARDVFKIFSGIAGASSGDYAILEAGADSVDLVFSEEDSEAALLGKMNRTLEKMQALFFETVPFRELSSADDPRFKVREDLLAVPLQAVEEEHEGADHAAGLRVLAQIASDPLKSPYFVITEDAIEPRKRFEGRGKCPWTADDIPYLIANNQRAPGRKDPYEEDGKDGAADSQARAPSPAAVSGKSDNAFDLVEFQATVPAAASSSEAPAAGPAPASSTEAPPPSQAASASPPAAAPAAGTASASIRLGNEKDREPKSKCCC